MWGVMMTLVSVDRDLDVTFPKLKSASSRCFGIGLCKITVSIPFTQALLQLSALKIGKGHTSMAWMYSGMAFRMAIDLGIFSDPSNSSSNDNNNDKDEHLQQRKQVCQQLAWSCYLWDKII